MTKVRQWPDNITSGDIRYGRSSNYDGFYLADAMHGLPTFGSVADSSPVSIRGQHVQVFNYPGQTEEIAKVLCDRWNAYPKLMESLHSLEASMVAILASDSRREGPAAIIPMWLEEVRGVIAAAKA